MRRRPPRHSRPGPGGGGGGLARPGGAERQREIHLAGPVRRVPGRRAGRIQRSRGGPSPGSVSAATCFMAACATTCCWPAAIRCRTGSWRRPWRTRACRWTIRPAGRPGYPGRGGQPRPVRRAGAARRAGPRPAVRQSPVAAGRAHQRPGPGHRTGLLATLFRQARARGVTLLLATHQPAVQAHFPRILHLRDGRALEDADG
jgi:hypothetical protein